jgi:hypothetical protein
MNLRCACSAGLSKIVAWTDGTFYTWTPRTAFDSQPNEMLNESKAQ